MTSVVQPALQVFHSKLDGTRVPTTLTTISHVPVLFPGGGGHILTFPVKPGDDCWLVFSERSIDNWYQHGGVQQPSDWRMHDINDPVCHVGVRSQPNVPGGSASRAAGPQVSATTVQLRSDDGKMVVDLNPANGTLTMTTPTEIILDTPLVTVTGVLDVTNVKGTGNVGTFNGTLHVTQDVIADVDVLGGGISQVNHIHSGVVSGGANTAKPVPGS
jgi:hypothetical protein